MLHFQNHATTVTFFFLENVLFPGGMGWEGISKVSFNFLYTLWVYKSCIIPNVFLKKCVDKVKYSINASTTWFSRELRQQSEIPSILRKRERNASTK